MKTIIFYGRTQMGVAVLMYLVAKGYKVKVIPEDNLVQNVCGYYDLEIVNLDTMGEFDLFICCHGSKIIDEKYLVASKYINMHSCLFKYRGKDPITRYIENKDTKASIESHYIIKEVDAGEVIKSIYFDTPVISTHGEYFNLAMPYYIECIEETLYKLSAKKRTVAMCRFKGDNTKLELWLSYYSKYFDELYVIGCQVSESDVSDLKKKYPFNFIYTDAIIYDLGAHQIVFNQQKELLKDHEWVLHADIDEFVVPTGYANLKSFMRYSKKDQTFCEGFQVFKSQDEGTLDYTKPILQQRKYWFKDTGASYNKPCLSRVVSDWTIGFHKINSMEDGAVRNIQNTGLILIHLKYADLTGGIEELNDGISRALLIPEYIKRML